MMSVVIIGGGLSGLSAGAALLQAGLDVTVIEKDNMVGGLARSFSRNGYVFDFGPHIFFGKKMVPVLRDYFGGKEVLVRNDNLRQGIYIRNELFKYPFQLKEILGKMAKRELLLVIRDMLLQNIGGKENQNHEDQSLEEWVKAKIGRTLFDYIELDTYVKKLYGISASEISSEWGKQKLKPLIKMSVWKSLNKSFNPFAKKGKSYTSYCGKGIGEIAAHLASFIVKNGGSILTNSVVETIAVTDNKVQEVRVRRKQEPINLSADFFISSMRASDLVNMIEPWPGNTVSNAGRALRYRNLIVVYLVVNKPRVFDHCLMYYSEKTAIFKRITDFRHFSEKMMPEDETILAVEICTNPEDEIWACEDKEVFERLIGQLEGLGVVGRKDVLDYFSVRIPASYPVYFLHYQDHLRVILDYLKNIENLVSIGRGGLYQHDNMSSAIATGFTVGQLVERYGRHDPGKVNKAVYDDRLDRYKNKV
jgi:protoporphyrinogen oxidase